MASKKTQNSEQKNGANTAKSDNKPEEKKKYYYKDAWSVWVVRE